jgi:voltage-gated potassium channel
MDQQQQPRPYQLFMLGLCIYVLIALAADTFFNLSDAASRILYYVDNAICFIFIADFFICLSRAKNKLDYLKWGWIDLISSIPMLSYARWGRLVRIFRILRVLRGVRSVKILLMFMLEKKAQSAFLTATFISIILLVFSSIAILQFEVVPESNITTPQDAVWWAFVTITTVGYGDKVPVTMGGRIISTVLMTAGVGLFGTFTGFVASWFLDNKCDEVAEFKAVRKELAEIKEQLANRA